jgi:hypothetical protein
MKDFLGPVFLHTLQFVLNSPSIEVGATLFSVVVVVAFLETTRCLKILLSSGYIVPTNGQLLSRRKSFFTPPFNLSNKGAIYQCCKLRHKYRLHLSEYTYVIRAYVEGSIQSAM